MDMGIYESIDDLEEKLSKLKKKTKKLEKQVEQLLAIETEKVLNNDTGTKTQHDAG